MPDSKLDVLWAPWRLEYVAESPAAKGGCFICDGLAKVNDRDNLVVWRTPLGVVILNRFPYNNGHLLIAPKAHKAELKDLNAQEVLDIQNALTQMISILDQLLKPEGYNIGLNLGKVAGAGLPGHLHWHLVPRWNGDTNFMTATSGTRVIVQSLEALYDLLQDALNPKEHHGP